MPYNRIYSNREEAIQAFGELYNIAMSHGEDGRQELHRYFDEDGNVASLIGIYHYKSNGVGDIEIKDGNLRYQCDYYLDEIVEGLLNLYSAVTETEAALSALTAQVDICCPDRQFLWFTNRSGYPCTLFLTSENGNDPVVYYAIEDDEFQLWETDTIESGYTQKHVTVEDGQTVYFYGINQEGFSFSSTIYSHFNADPGKWDSGGNIMSLLSPFAPMDIPNDYCFYGLFIGFDGLMSSAEIPATGLTRYCYAHMYQGCSNLQNAPQLPAPKVFESSYAYMFSWCSGLEVTPEFPATELAEHCYERMFEYCVSLRRVEQLPAREVFAYSYAYMFHNCTALGEPQPELPAYELAEYCYYNMFSWCRRLKRCPNLPAKTLAPYCYAHMFEYCDLVLQELNDDYLNAAENDGLAEYCYSYMFADCHMLATPMKKLPSVVFKIYCYEYMFYNCYDLKRTPIFSTKQMNEGCFQYMFKNCQTLVTEEVYANINNHDYAPKNCCREMFAGCVNMKATIEMTIFQNTVHDHCFDGMYSGCTILEECSLVNFAQTLNEGCYENMFAYTRIKKVNPLNAVSGATDCYKRMFYECNSLIYIPCKLSQPSSSYTDDWVVNVAQTGEFVKNPAVPLSGPGSWDELPSGDGVPANWVVNDMA